MRIKRSAHKARERLVSILRYALLIIVCSVVLLPLLMLFSTSGKDLFGLVDPQVYWIPTQFDLSNYAKAFNALGGIGCFARGILLMGAVTLGQVVISMITAYGFAKYHFPGQKILFAVMVLAFFVPREITFLPQYILYSNYGMLGTAWTLLIPTWLGQGVKSTLIMLLYYQFIRTMPKALEEAAMIDGATLPGIMVRIGFPLTTPATVISAVLTFAWNWNDTYFAQNFFDNKIVTPALALVNVQNLFANMYTGARNNMSNLFHDGIEAAAGILVILPLLVLYALLEKKLIESIDRAGITGE